jgi:hypothetical protein
MCLEIFLRKGVNQNQRERNSAERSFKPTSTSTPTTTTTSTPSNVGLCAVFSCMNWKFLVSRKSVVGLLPTAEQAEFLSNTLKVCQTEHLFLVRERQSAWRETPPRGVTSQQQMKSLRARKRGWKNPLCTVYNTVLKNVVDRVEIIFKSKHHKAKTVPPPHFKYPTEKGHWVKDGRLWLSAGNYCGERLKPVGIPMVAPWPQTPAQGLKIELTDAGWVAEFRCWDTCPQCKVRLDEESASGFCSAACEITYLGGCLLCMSPGCDGDCK